MANGGGKSKTGFSSGKLGMVLRIKQAIIIYPALMTPAVVTADDLIQIILLGKKKRPININDINWQLKIRPGLDPAKSYIDKPLFKRDVWRYITITGTHDLKDDVYSTPSHFSGILDKRAREVFKDAKFEKVYCVSIHNDFMKDNGVYNAFWVYAADSQYQTMSVDPDFKTSNPSRTLNTLAGGKYFSNDRGITFV